MSSKVLALKLERLCAAESIPREGLELMLQGDATSIDRAIIYLLRRVYCIGDFESPRAQVVRLRKEFKVPLNWFEAFKLHFCGRWWMRRYVAKHPVKYSLLVAELEETVTARIMFPEIPPGYRVHEIMSGGYPVEHVKCKFCEGQGSIEKYPMDIYGRLPR